MLTNEDNLPTTQNIDDNNFNKQNKFKKKKQQHNTATTTDEAPVTVNASDTAA